MGEASCAVGQTEGILSNSLTSGGRNKSPTAARICCLDPFCVRSASPWGRLLCKGSEFLCHAATSRVVTCIQGQLVMKREVADPNLVSLKSGRARCSLETDDSIF